MLNWWYETMPDWLGFVLFVGIPMTVFMGLVSWAIIESAFQEGQRQRAKEERLERMARDVEALRHKFQPTETEVT